MKICLGTYLHQDRQEQGDLHAMHFPQLDPLQASQACRMATVSVWPKGYCLYFKHVRRFLDASNRYKYV